MPGTHADTIREGIEAFNRRDFDAALELLDDGIVWHSFLSQTQGEVLGSKEEIRAAWESQVDVLDLRAEPEEYIPVGDDKVVVPIRMVACGRGSEMSLAASIVWVWTLGDDGRGTCVEVFDTRESALAASGLAG